MSKIKESIDLDSLWDFGLNFLKNWSKKVSGSGMTDADKELTETSLRNQQTLNQEEYDRKIDFYQQFESPSAQVRQYKEAGLNPMLLSGSGASVSASGGIGSAGSAPAQSAGVATGLLGDLLNFSLRRKQLDIDKFDAETRRKQADAMSEYYGSRTVGQNQINDTFYTMFGLKSANLEADTAAKMSQTDYLYQMAQSEPFRRRLMESGIKLNDSQTAINEVQKAINEAALKYSDKYYKAISEISMYQSTILNVESSVAERLNKKGVDLVYHRAVAEAAQCIFDAGMSLDIWEGDAFKNSVSGTMTKKDWTQGVLGLIKTTITAGAGYAGVKAMAAARGAAHMAAPVLWTPGMQNQFYSATGYRYDSTL